MSKTKLFVIFFVALIVFVTFKLPVALVTDKLPLPKGVAYQGIEGSLWQGQVARLQIGKQQLSRVKWQFEPSELFTANLGFSIKFGKARDSETISGKGVILYGLSGLQLVNSTVRVPAKHIGPMLPLPVPGIEGRLLLEIAEYSRGEKMCQSLAGELSWNQAAVDFGGPIDLGLISSQLSCEQDKLLASFDANNKLGLEGIATVESQSKYNFNGFLKPDASLPKVIHDNVRFFDGPDSKGKYKIKL